MASDSDVRSEEDQAFLRALKFMLEKEGSSAPSSAATGDAKSVRSSQFAQVRLGRLLACSGRIACLPSQFIV